MRGPLSPSETQFQHAVLDLATLRDWLYFHDYDSRKNPAGFPDLCLVHKRTGQLLFAELKTETGRVSTKQRRWIDALARGGHAVYVWRPADLRSGAIARALTPSDVVRTVPA